MTTLYLLSDDVRIMGCFSLEGAVVGPQVDGRGDTSYSSFVDLEYRLATSSRSKRLASLHSC